VAEELPEGVLDAPSGGLNASGDAALGDRFSGDAGDGVDVVGEEGAVLVGDPGHFTAAGSHVGRRYVQARADVAFLCKLLREPPGDAFQLGLTELPGVDGQAALGAAEGDVDDGALVGHQRGQRLNVVLGHAGGVSDSTLHGQAMLAVDRPVAGKNMIAVAEFYEEANLVDVVARLDLIRQTRGKVQGGRGPIEHQVHAVPERRFLRGHGCPFHLI
jgi:hypothetical protein